MFVLPTLNYICLYSMVVVFSIALWWLIGRQGLRSSSSISRIFFECEWEIVYFILLLVTNELHSTTHRNLETCCAYLSPTTLSKSECSFYSAVFASFKQTWFVYFVVCLKDIFWEWNLFFGFDFQQIVYGIIRTILCYLRI